MDIVDAFGVCAGSTDIACADVESCVAAASATTLGNFGTSCAALCLASTSTAALGMAGVAAAALGIVGASTTVRGIASASTAALGMAGATAGTGLGEGGASTSPPKSSACSGAGAAGSFRAASA